MRGWTIALTLACLAPAGGTAQEVLTRAAEVRALPVDRASAGAPVELEVVVGYVEPGSTVFVQDETGGTFFRPRAGQGAAFLPGDRVRVKGVTVPGLYLPGIDAGEVRLLGKGAPPEPVSADFEDLARGRWHYQLVRVEGVGRRISALDENRTLLHVALGSRLVEVRVDAPPPADAALVDARLRITGLAAGGINDRRQLVFPYLRVGGWDGVEVARPAPELEKLPLIPAARLLIFAPARADEMEHRVRLRGTVLAAFDDGRVFVRDEPAAPAPDGEPARPAALAARLIAPMPLEAGQMVELAGFPNMEGFSASLADAVLTDSAEPSLPPPPPVPVSVREWNSGAHDADLVALEGLVQDVFRGEAGLEVRVDFGGTPVKALLPSAQEPPLLKPGSRARLTGICRVESSTDRGFRSQPERVTLWMRGPHDLAVLKAPSWWTAGRLVAVIGVLSAALVLALLWSSLLRRQVARQAEALGQRIARQAALEERQRIAREFHDTLEQELAGLNLRLDAALTRPLEEKARNLLGASRHLVGRIQSEARNLVADLRSAPDTVPDLRAALEEIAARAPADTPPRVRVDSGGPLPALPVHVVHHLLMIAREAVTNAMKHARAREIRLSARAQAGTLILEIEDDGLGIPPGATEGRPGHFGCMGIRERCRKIGAQVEWRPGPAGQGTLLTVTLPPAG